MCLEAYFGCDCGCLDHVVRLSYFPPRNKEEEKAEDNVIYINVRTENYFSRILPPLSIFPSDWASYFYYHILKRIPIAINYLFNSSYKRKYGILDCADFKNKDLLLINNFINNLTEETKQSSVFSAVYLNNEKWEIVFSNGRNCEKSPYEFGWYIQFLPRNIFGRIRYALKYLFGTHCKEQEFEINKNKAVEIKEMIRRTIELNEKNNS